VTSLLPGFCGQSERQNRIGRDFTEELMRVWGWSPKVNLLKLFQIVGRSSVARRAHVLLQPEGAINDRVR